MDSHKKWIRFGNPISVIGYSLLVFLAVWIVHDLTRPAILQNRGLLPLGAAFEGNLALPRERIEAAFKEAKDVMENDAKSSLHYSVAAKSSDWAAFACMAVITILAGFMGQPPRPATPQPGGQEASPQSIPSFDQGQKPGKGIIRVIAVLAATASVLAALSSKSWSESQRLRDSALTLNSDLTSARKAIMEAKPAQDAEAVLSNLKAMVLRNQ